MDILTGAPIVILLLVAFFAAGMMVFFLAYKLSKRTAERDQSARRVAGLYQLNREKSSRVVDLEEQLHEPALSTDPKTARIVEIPHTDAVQLKSGGSLAFAEFYRPDLPFHPQRAYWLFNWGMNEQGDAHLRGAHAHRECEQFFVVLKGGIRFTLATGPDAIEDVISPRLLSPTQGLYVPAMTFLTMEPLADDTLVVCFCSRHFDEDDYIREWKDFIELVAKAPKPVS